MSQVDQPDNQPKEDGKDQEEEETCIPEQECIRHQVVQNKASPRQPQTDEGFERGNAQGLELGHREREICDLS